MGVVAIVASGHSHKNHNCQKRLKAITQISLTKLNIAALEIQTATIATAALSLKVVEVTGRCCC